MPTLSSPIWIPYAAWIRLRQKWARARNYVALRLARTAQPATAFISQPEPRSYGMVNRGALMLGGTFLVDGDVVEQGTRPLWSLPEGAGGFADRLHGFAWLDDLAAVDTTDARQRAQEWLFEWIVSCGGGLGPGWAPDVTGRRVVRWINHAILILHQTSSDQSRAFFQSLGHQSRFLAKRWRSMRPGLPRFEALTGLAYCGLALEGQGQFLAPALRALGREAAREVKADGGISSRNPEELLEVFTLLSWVNQAVSYAGHDVDPEILRALERMAPAIRALRLGDGSMARFHGGGSAQADRIDRALADAGIRSPARVLGAMDYSRISASGTLIVVDTGRLPPVHSSQEAHACTLAFEMSSGRVPMLVNMGPARGHGADVEEASRATAAHNALTLSRASLARFAADGFVGRTFGKRLIDAPSKVTVQRDSNEHGLALLASHDGYRAAQGLTHERQLALLHSGRQLQGVDRVFCQSTADKVRFGRASRGRRARYIPMRLHFRLHPDVIAELDLGGKATSLSLPNGEIWVLRSEHGKMALTGATYIEQGRLRPRVAQQVVVTARASDYEGVIEWSLTRTE